MQNAPWLRITFGVFLLAALFWLVEPAPILDAIGQADPAWIVAGFLVFSLHGLIEAWRLKAAFGTYQLTFLEAYRLFWVGIFFGNFLPGSLGTDVYQVHYLNSKVPGLVAPVTLSVAVRIWGVLANLVLAAFGFVRVDAQWLKTLALAANQGRYLLLILGAILLIASVVFTIGLKSKVHKRISSLNQKLKSLYRQILASLSLISMPTQVQIFFLSVLVVLVRIVSFSIILHGLGVSLGWPELTLVVTLTTLTSLIPLTFSGLGVTEVSVTLLLAAFSVPLSTCAAASVISRVFIWGLSVIGGAVFMGSKYRQPVDGK